MYKAIVLGLLVLGAAGLSAGDADAGGRKKGDKLIEQLDLNRDGYISRDEADAYRGGRFEEMDLDGDGAVSRGEMMERLRRKMEDEFGRRFDRLDRNRDGRIDPSEYRGSDSPFDRLDRDGDGQISVDELRRGGKRN